MHLFNLTYNDLHIKKYFYSKMEHNKKETKIDNIEINGDKNSNLMSFIFRGRELHPESRLSDLL